ncbi:MAG: GNAT family N-acetyltransferase [Candidatus Hodarchaeales archaeon]
MLTRRANSNDTADIIRFYYKTPYSFFRGTLIELEMLCSRWPFWITEAKGKVIGFVFSSNYDQSYAWISGLGISSPNDDTGVGDFLLDSLENHFLNSTNAIVVRETPHTKKWTGLMFSERNYEPLCTVLAYEKQLSQEKSLSNKNSSRQIGFAGKHDIGVVRSIDAQCFTGIFRYSTSAFARLYKNASLRLIATDAANGNPVGFLIAYVYQKKFANIARIAILPNYRHQRLGLALMASCTKEMANRNCLRLTLNTQKDNYAARNLYEKLGFNLMGSETVTIKQLTGKRIGVDECV